MAQLAIVQRIYDSEDLPPGEGQALWGFLLTFKVASYKKGIPSATSQDVSIHWKTKAFLYVAICLARGLFLKSYQLLLFLIPLFTSLHLVNSVDRPCGNQGSNRKDDKKLISWVAVMVNFVCQLDWATRCPDFGQTLFCVYNWGYYRMRLTLKRVDWIKQIVLPHVAGLIQSDESLKEQKGEPFSK